MDYTSFSGIVTTNVGNYDSFDYTYNYTYTYSYTYNYTCNYTYNPIKDIKDIIKNIHHVGSRIVPKESYDIITYEDINDGDILIDFLRDDKTEYEYNTYYKESTLEYILQNKKNQFTMKPIDIASIVKYIAKN
jgi:hypothetical protein